METTSCPGSLAYLVQAIPGRGGFGGVTESSTPSVERAGQPGSGACLHFSSHRRCLGSYASKLSLLRLAGDDSHFPSLPMFWPKKPSALQGSGLLSRAVPRLDGEEGRRGAGRPHKACFAPSTAGTRGPGNASSLFSPSSPGEGRWGGRITDTTKLERLG